MCERCLKTGLARERKTSHMPLTEGGPGIEAGWAHESLKRHTTRWLRWFNFFISVFGGLSRNHTPSAPLSWKASPASSSS